VEKKNRRLINGYYIHSTENILVMYWGSIALLCILIGKVGFFLNSEISQSLMVTA